MIVTVHHTLELEHPVVVSVTTTLLPISLKTTWVVIVTALGDVVTVDPLIGDVLTNEFARAADELNKVRSNIAEEIMVLRT